MYKIGYILVTLLLLLQQHISIAQNNRECLKEVIALEEKVNFRNDSSIKDKNIFISYAVRVTDWDNQVTVSNAKIYRNDEFMHFFSEQANIYQDTKEVVMIMPQQRMAVISSTTKELNNTKINDAFFQMRRKFLDSCEIVRCDLVGAKKVLELKVKKADRTNNITSMVYEYDLEKGKIESVKVNYNADYKIKQLQITYKEFSLNSTYQFANARKYLVDKNGKLLAKLSGYELVDNRDQKKKNKK